MSSPRTPKTLFAELSGSTTMHGLKYTYESQPKIRQVLWIVVFLGVVGAFSWHLSQLVQKLVSHPVNTETTFKRESRQAFPAVTVCNMNAVKLSYKAEVLNLTNDVEKSFNRTDSSFYDQQASNSTSYSNNDTSSSNNATFGNDTWMGQETCVPDIYTTCEVVIDEPVVDVNSTTPVSYNATRREYSSRMRFFTNYAMVNAEKRKEFGHQFEDMILTCTFAGDPCDRSDFVQFQTVSHGNCYTFNIDTGARGYKRRDALGVGPIEGLTLYLNAEEDENIPELTDGTGWTIVVHSPKEMPDADGKGILAAPGFLSEIGITKEVVLSAKDPFGNCQDMPKDGGQGFLRKNGFKNILPQVEYSAEACMLTCIQAHIMLDCLCTDPFMPPINNTQFAVWYVEQPTSVPLNSLPTCLLYNQPTADCISDTTKNHRVNRDSYCNKECPTPCREPFYRTTGITMARWPADEAEKSVVNQTIKNHMGTAFAETMGNMSSTEETKFFLGRNFGKVMVYFSDMTVTEITTQGVYAGWEFLNDFGGCAGLWLSMSLLTIAEVLEFFVDVIGLLFCRSKRKKLPEADTELVGEKTTHH